jgi:XTP/dITP diphosphohydrolase
MTGDGAAERASTLLVATTNPGKLIELRALLPDLTILAPPDVGALPPVEETGTTFVENARLKATAYHQVTGLRTMGEDSGIEIEALDGEPGVYSARYHGLPDGPVKNAHVLELLRDIPDRRRGCRYVCAIVFIDRDGREHIFQGQCRGRIARSPAGEGGFGYDPIFLVPRLGRTMAELSADEKNRISHRGLAVRKLARHLSAEATRRRGARAPGATPRA